MCLIFDAGTISECLLYMYLARVVLKAKSHTGMLTIQQHHYSIK